MPAAEPGAWAYPWPVDNTVGEPAQVPPPPRVTVLPATAPRRDPRHTALAAVLVFVALLVALWAILGYVEQTAGILGRISRSNDELAVQLRTANTRLVTLDRATAQVRPMSASTHELDASLVKIDVGMGAMQKDVDAIATRLQHLDQSLTTLDERLVAVDGSSRALGADLGRIGTMLDRQHSQVRTLRTDVDATGRALHALPPRVRATSSRLAYVNYANGAIGRNGIRTHIKVRVRLFGFSQGEAWVFAGLIPPGSWR